MTCPPAHRERYSFIQTVVKKVLGQEGVGGGGG